MIIGVHFIYIYTVRSRYLMESGRNDLAFLIANQTTFPSYGHFLAQGYTTWPEQVRISDCAQ